MGIKAIYEHKYKGLLIIPLIMVLLALAQIGFQYYSTGDFITKSVTLSGGISLEIDTQYKDLDGLRLYLNDKFLGEEFNVRATTVAGQQKGIIVEGTDVSKNELSAAIKEKLGDQAPPLESLSKNVKNVSARFSSKFFRTAIIAVLFAFLFMGLVVFYYFRIPIPSLAVVLAAFSDIVITIAIFNTLGMRLTLGGVVAFLMLIGYSVDTDILLSTRVLKHRTGSYYARTIDAMKTGLTMSFTTIAALGAGIVFAQSEVLKQVMIILFIGLIVDLPMTWLQNAGILRWYLDKKAAQPETSKTDRLKEKETRKEEKRKAKEEKLKLKQEERDRKAEEKARLDLEAVAEQESEKETELEQTVEEEIEEVMAEEEPEESEESIEEKKD
ncbi:protein translocase subunit SecF [Candidatus Woesearchaeota archaeon]|nr:protein translocase subunit SecF [Candidatus Woesearchaeota archaeon]